jgi:D-ribose pyranose/furanose isomerase RbsD
MCSDHNCHSHSGSENDYSKDILKELLTFIKKFESDNEVTKVLDLFNNDEKSKDFLLTLFKQDVNAHKDSFLQKIEDGESLDFLKTFKVFKTVKLHEKWDEMTTEDKQMIYGYVVSFNFVDNNKIDEIIERAKGFFSDFKMEDFISNDEFTEIKDLLQSHEHLLELEIFEEIFAEIQYIDFSNIQKLINDFQHQRGKLFGIFMKVQTMVASNEIEIDTDMIQETFNKLYEKLSKNKKVQGLIKDTIKKLSKNKAFKKLLKTNGLDLGGLMGGANPLSAISNMFSVGSSGETEQLTNEERRKKRREKERKRYRRELRKKLKGRRH